MCMYPFKKNERQGKETTEKSMILSNFQRSILKVRADFARELKELKNSDNIRIISFRILPLFFLDLPLLRLVLFEKTCFASLSLWLEQFRESV